MTLREQLLKERKNLIKKDILDKKDQDLLLQIDLKLLDMEDVDVLDNTIRWDNGKTTVLYYPEAKATNDQVEVLVDGKLMIPKVKWNLRDNMAAREKFQKKLGGWDNNFDYNALIEINKLITSSVGCVCSVDTSEIKENKNNNYTPIADGDMDDITLIHPALDFTEDKMYIGANYPAQDSDGNVDLMPFIIHNNSTLSIPELAQHGIKLTKQPMVYKKFFTLITPDSYTQPTYPTLRSCFEAIKNELDTYIEFSEASNPTLISLWVLGTYMHKMFNSYPYISLLGYKGTGKTKVMDVCSLMAFNGTTSVGISAPALFRGTDLLSWTLFFDEAELFSSGKKKSNRAEELTPLILNGYRRGGLVPRVGSKEGGFKLEFFHTYCPKMFASTEEMDWILESRCIQVVMRPACKGGVGEIELNEHAENWEHIRTDILLACLKEWKTVKEIYYNADNDTNLDNRDYEIAKPLLSIAKYISDEVYNEIKEYLEESNISKSDDVHQRSEFYILKALVSLDRWNDLLDSYTITNKVSELKGGTKPEWMNSTWLGKNLKKFNFVFEKPRSGKGYNYIFEKMHVYNACIRFGIDPVKLYEEYHPEPVQIKSDDQNMNSLGAFA